MRAWPVRAEQIAGVVLMAETKGIVEAEGFDRCHSLNAPATEVAAHFQRMFHRANIPEDLQLGMTLLARASSLNEFVERKSCRLA